MERLCGRPGCSESASVAYGMVPTDLVFWLSALPLDPDPDGVLCRRHADAMVVPRGWTLDDRRDPDLHLFRPPDPTKRAAPVRQPRVEVADMGRQLDLELSVVDEPVEEDVPAHSDEHEPAPWSPDFDEADDLDGLLSARSPLLSRAFRTADRPDH